MASIFQDSVAEALARQPWYIRRKDTLTAVAGTVLQAVNLVTAFTTDMPEWANILIAVVVGLAQILIHAGTKGAITPSMAYRLEDAGQAAHLDMPDPARILPASYESDPSDDLPVYEGETIGRHRAED